MVVVNQNRNNPQEHITSYLLTPRNDTVNYTFSNHFAKLAIQIAVPKPNPLGSNRHVLAGWLAAGALHRIRLYCQKSSSVPGVTFSDWPVCLQEVWLEVDLEQVPCDPFHGIINGQHVDAFAVLHIWTRLDAEMRKSCFRSQGWLLVEKVPHPPSPAIAG